MTAPTYYDRTTHSDTSFAIEADRIHEQDVKTKLEQTWQCELHHFGQFASIDWYAVRRGRMIGLVELKGASYGVDRYPSALLNVRKWTALTLASAGLQVPAIFVIRYTDALCWCRLTEIDASKHRMGGCKQIVKSRNDIEPVIDVPVASLHRLRARPLASP